MIVLVHGPDAALARAAVAKVVRDHDSTGANTTVLDGATVSLNQVITSVGSLGFFNEGRVVVVQDLMTRAARPVKSSASDEDGSESSGASPPLDLAPLFRSVPDRNVLVLVDRGLAAVPAAVRTAAPSDTVVVAAEPPRGQQLVAWLIAAAGEEGARLDAGTARQIAEKLYPQTWSAKPANPRYDRPPDLDQLANEVAKLALAAHPGPITRRHVDALVASGDDDRIFRFVEAAANGQLAGALTEIRRLFDAGEEPAKLAAQVLQQIELAGVLDAGGTRLDPAAVGRSLGLTNPNRMVGIARSRRGQRPGAAVDALATAAAVDRQTKRGELRHPVDALYALMADVASTRSHPTTRHGGT